MATRIQRLKAKKISRRVKLRLSNLRSPSNNNNNKEISHLSRLRKKKRNSKIRDKVGSVASLEVVARSSQQKKHKRICSQLVK